MVTENETVLTMEATLSGEQEDASEEPEEKENVVEDTVETEEKEVEAKTEKTEETEVVEKRYSDNELKSAVDKATNRYRDRYEKVTAQNKDLITQRNELKKQLRERSNSSEFDVLFNADLEDGMEESKAKKLNELRQKFRTQYDELNDKAEELEEYADVVDTINKNIDQEYVQAWGLDDPNPYARAMNSANIINESIGLYKKAKALMDILEIRAASGTELRKEMEKSATELAGLSKDAQKLYLERLADGLKATPKEAPPKPSEKASSDSGLTHKKIAAMSAEEKWRRNDEIVAFYANNPL